MKDYLINSFALISGECINNINDTTKNSSNIKLFNIKSEENKNNDIVADGENACVSIEDNAKNSIVPGFTQYHLSIVTKDNKQFNINLHIAKNINKDDLDKTIKRLVRVLSNMNQDALDNLGIELKNILLTNEIMFNKNATAQAIAPLNQVFVSTKNFANMSDEECLATITHELGHLIDHSKDSTIRGKATKFWDREFNDLKNSLNTELGFKTDSHMFDNCSEFFADYYAYKTGAMIDTPTRKAKTQFNLMEKYLSDIKNYTDDELNAKYGGNIDSVKKVALSYKKLKSEFEYYLSNINNGSINIEDRADENMEPMNYEQLSELQNKK